MVEWLAILLHIHNILGLILYLPPSLAIRFIFGFTQSLQENSGVVLYTTP
jgi:hypothetical protein